MWRPPLGQQQLRKELHRAMLSGDPRRCQGGRPGSRAGSVAAVKKLLLVLLVVALGVAAYRRFSGSHAPASARTHQHGTPDHWPPVVRKPDSKGASAA